ncbi:MAG TPA: hypothetical protein VF838_16360 [Trebonia sp.]
MLPDDGRHPAPSHREEIPGPVRVSERFDPDHAHRDVYDHAYDAFLRHYRGNRAVYAKLNARAA